jgi:DNA-directed RNA polymerase subunit RPC12/RpoP
MATYECVSCANEFDVRKRAPTRCPECRSRKLITHDANPRQKGDDDGVEYGHPGDELRERRERMLAED